MVLQLKTPEELKDLYIWIAIVRYFLAAAVVTINGGILVAFISQKYRQRSKGRRLLPSGVFIINLLMADIMVGAAILLSLRYKIWPENAVILAKWHYWCLLRFATGFLAICGSHNALLSVVIDRYIAVVHTMRYKDWMTTRNTWFMIAASWILPVTGWTYIMCFGKWTPTVPTCNENTIIAAFSLYVWLPIQIVLLLSIVVIQICVHLELQRYDGEQCLSPVILRRSTRRSARVMLISTLAFVLCYGPYDVAALVFVFWPSSTTKLFYDLCAIGATSSFLINPCLYSFKTESIRKPVSELLAHLRKSVSRLFCSRLVETDNKNVINEANGLPGKNLKFLGPSRTCSTATLSTSLEVYTMS